MLSVKSLYRMKQVIKLIAFTTLLGLASSQNCRPDQFECANGKCVHESAKCNYWQECGDGSDEPPLIDPELCPPCAWEEFRCGNGKCVFYFEMCDGFDQCGDNSDEESTEDPDKCPKCPEFYFQCGTGRCIHPTFVCDGINSCGDLSDEMMDPADCPACSDEQYRCTSGRCIGENALCNRIKDCPDYDDETKEKCPCANDETRCGDYPAPPGEWMWRGECIPSEWWCDEEHIWDCIDGSDEADCTQKVNHISADKAPTKTLRHDYKTGSLKVHHGKKTNQSKLVKN